MDSNTEALDFPATPSPHHSFVYHQGNEDGIVIDLGLSLGTVQPESYHPSERFLSPVEYGHLLGWPQLHSYMKSSNRGHPMVVPEDCDDETEGVQSKQRWASIKVNMEGVIVGRKVCILDHAGYSSLALQLEDMFGKHCVSGLRLFQAESEFSLFYKDINENWRTVGNAPWK
ncbi:hypothetical protein HHK36_024612 [Tetracentron sinense]|uniref:Auxin-responsive protein n=1 Tax=Tetracentron sinense TaxID=13715 RepID=A0A835D4T4_TETSI|nr:hypothetical protein HHK36_024612 [Tetracentron sinense]